MPNFQSDAAKGIQAAPFPENAGGVVAKRYEISVLAAQLVLGNIFELAPIPAGTRVLDAILDAEDLDSNGSPLVTLDVGIMSGEWGDPSQSRTCGNEFFAASTVAQAGTAARMSAAGGFRTTVDSTKNRSIGVKVAAAPATAVAGKIGLTVYVAAE